MIKSFVEHRCKASSCGLRFQPVEWLPWRVAGFCSEKCEGGTGRPSESPWLTLALRDARSAAAGATRDATAEQGALW